jgi:hypothetical protein
VGRFVVAILAAGCAGFSSGTYYPAVKERLSALDPFEPLPVAEAAPKP